MPPKRCPECGRFLSNELVALLADASLPCPRCATPLQADELLSGARPSRRAQRAQAAEVPSATATAAEPSQEDDDGGEDDVPGGNLVPGSDPARGGDEVPGGDPARGGGQVPGGDPARGGDPAPGGDHAVPSVRPPDLDPNDVQDRSADVLAGWDVGVTPDEIRSWRADHRPFPTDAVVVVFAALVGGVLGAAVVERHRALGAAVGVLFGGAAAGAARRVWELEG